MQIVIEISEEDYKLIKSYGKGSTNYRISLNLYDAVRDGTPLPEHHGRLVDADRVNNTLDIYVINEYNGQFIRRSDIDKIPTIIEGSEEE